MDRSSSGTPATDREPVAEAVKAQLAQTIVGALDRQGLTVREAGSHTGYAAADFSRVRNGQLGRFSIERLLDMANRLGERLEISVKVLPRDGRFAVPESLVMHLKPLRALCRRFNVRRLCVFGSVLRPDFDPKRSDIDLTVDFGRSPSHGPVEQYFSFKESLERLLGREIDLIEIHAMPDSRLKRIIERTEVPVYEQAA
jgi:predicted nucleotidyltransferase/predicted XRE-type DNA-binding protein